MVSAVQIGLDLDTFLDLTYSEFSIYLEAHQRKQDIRMREMAYFTSCLMNCWTKKKIKPTMLYNHNSKGKGSVNLTGLPVEVVKAHYRKKIQQNKD